MEYSAYGVLLLRSRFYALSRLKLPGIKFLNRVQPRRGPAERVAEWALPADALSVMSAVVSK